MALRAALLIAVASSTLVACSDKDAAAGQGANATSAAMAVTTAPVVVRALPRSVAVSGAVAAVEEMQLGVEVGGLRVTALSVDVGETVRRGQVLLRLDTRMLDSELAQAAAALREAEAGAGLARANLARGQNLVRDRYISATQLDELRAARTQSEARVGTARAMHDAAALRRSFAELRAPADGVISKRLVQPGQVVMAGGELLRLIRDGRLEWRAELPVAELAAVAPGDRITLRAPGGAEVEGRVRAVSPGVDIATRTGTVYADLPQPEGLAPGAYVEGRIDTGTVDAATVPTAAVVLRDGFPTVFVVDTKAGVNLAHAVRVRTGAKGGDAVQILDGPKPGQSVVTTGAGFLADGDRIRIVAAPAKAAATTPTTTPATAAGSAMR
ncbi:MAG: efflux RND transporter periplasmic adaptor subunit [Xanthomonadaceae bacterium]|nr:efflux RND transporter periplasmic adaptor subunit [Xanthomonadaceae bacterium]